MRLRAPLAGLVLAAAWWLPATATPARATTATHAASAAAPSPSPDVVVLRGTIQQAQAPEGGTQVTFVGGGFTPVTRLETSVDGRRRGSVTSSASGAFTARLHFPDAGLRTLAVTGPRAGGGQLVVTAEIRLPEASRATADGSSSAGASHVYLALASGFGVVATVILVVFSVRVLSRMPGR